MNDPNPMLQFPPDKKASAITVQADKQKTWKMKKKPTSCMCSFAQLFLKIYVDMLSLFLGWPNLKTLSGLFEIFYLWFT